MSCAHIICYIVPEHLQQQLLLWLSGKYAEKPGKTRILCEVVDAAQKELFPGVSETCLTALIAERLTSVFPSVTIETSERKPLR